MEQRTPGTMEIEDMPRGGYDASWLDRHLQTDVLEYTGLANPSENEHHSR